MPRYSSIVAAAILLHAFVVDSFSPNSTNTTAPLPTPTPPLYTWDWATWSLAPTGTGLEYASHCDSAQALWTGLRSWWTFPTVSPTFSTVWSYSYYSTLTSFVDPSTTCGITRAKAASRTLSLTSVSYNTVSLESSSGYSSQPIYPSPTPACQIGVGECNQMWTSFDIETSAWTKNSVASINTVSLASPPSSMIYNGQTIALPYDPLITSPPALPLGTLTVKPSIETSYLTQINGTNATSTVTVTKTKYWIVSRPGRRRQRGSTVTVEPGLSTTWSIIKTYPNTPHCTPQMTAGNAGGECYLDVRGNVKLLYFPVSANRSSDSCTKSQIDGHLDPFVWPTALPNAAPYPNASRTVVSGTTFDARSVYFSYESIVATAFAGRTIGNVHTSGVVAVNPAHLVSMRAGRYARDRYQYWTLSLGDLNEPIPISAFWGMPSCRSWMGGCAALVDNEYIPECVIPPEMQALDPAWASCHINRFSATPVPLVSPSAVTRGPTAGATAGGTVSIITATARNT